MMFLKKFFIFERIDEMSKIELIMSLNFNFLGDLSEKYPKVGLKQILIFFEKFLYF